MVPFALHVYYLGVQVGLNASYLSRLMKNPFSTWSYASRVFQGYESKSEIHKTSMLRKDNFLDNF